MRNSSQVWLGVGIAVVAVAAVAIAGSASKKSPSAPAALPPSAGFRSYTVQSGDYLSSVAQQLFSDRARPYELWPILYDDNRSAIGLDPDVLQVGTVLRVRPSNSITPTMEADARRRFQEAVS